MVTPWDILYADDLQIARKTRFGSKKRLSEKICALKKLGLRVNREKTKYLSTDKATNASIDLQGTNQKNTPLQLPGLTLNEETNCED